MLRSSENAFLEIACIVERRFFSSQVADGGSLVKTTGSKQHVASANDSLLSVAFD